MQELLSHASTVITIAVMLVGLGVTVYAGGRAFGRVESKLDGIVGEIKGNHRETLGQVADIWLCVRANAADIDRRVTLDTCGGLRTLINDRINDARINGARTRPMTGSPDPGSGESQGSQ